MIDKHAPWYYVLAIEGTASADDFLARVRALNGDVLRLRVRKLWSVFVGGDLKYRRQYQAQVAVLRSQSTRYWLAWTHRLWKNLGPAA